MLTDFLCHTQPSVATTTYFDVYYYFNLKHVRAMFCEVSGTFLALATDPVFHALGAGATENARHEFSAPDCRGGKCET